MSFFDKETIMAVAQCVVIAVLFYIGYSFLSDPNKPPSDRKVCETKGGFWYTPYMSEGVCIKKEMLL